VGGCLEIPDFFWEWPKNFIEKALIKWLAHLSRGFEIVLNCYQRLDVWSMNFYLKAVGHELTTTFHCSTGMGYYYLDLV